MSERSTSLYPGTPQHQALLGQIVAYYQDDPRVLAIVLFGSLSRGNWDAHSDIDLDVVVADGVKLDTARELEGLCASFAAVGERLAMLVPDGDEEADIVLESLMQLSVRYHPLAGTSPHIVESMRVLAGRLEPSVIAEAGNANQTRAAVSPQDLLHQCVYYSAVATVGLQRQQVWATVEVLHRMRGYLMELFARTHGG